MEVKMIEELYVTETLEEVKKSFLAIYYKKYLSLIAMSIIFFIFAFIIDSSFGATFMICVTISFLELIWYFISVFGSTRKVMKEYKKLDPKPTRVRIYEDRVEIYIESNENPVENIVSYDEINKIIYDEKKENFVFNRRGSTFVLKRSDISSESYEFLKTKLKG